MASLKFLFSRLEQGLRTSCDVSVLPAYYFTAVPDSNGIRRRCLHDVLTRSDVFLSTVGFRSAEEIVLPFRMREELDLSLPIAYFPLGEFPRGAIYYRGIYKYLRNYDTLLFSSSADLAIFKTLVQFTPAKSEVVPFGIDYTRFSRRTFPDPAEVRNNLGIEDDEIVILYVGRVTREKNAHSILPLFVDLCREFDNLRLLIVGPVSNSPFRTFKVPKQQKVRSVTSSMVKLANDRVLFLGSQSDVVPSIMACADIFINLTLHHDENFGLVNAEAMASRLPVIGTAWGGLQDVIEDGKTGFQVPTTVTRRGVRFDAWHALCRLRELIKDPKLRRAMGRRARRRVAGHFTMNRFVDNVRAEIVDCLARGKRKRKSKKHAFSQFGRVFNQAYSNQGNPTSPVFDFSGRYDFYAKLIAGYTSDEFDRDEEIQEEEVVFCTSKFLAVRGKNVLIDDPLWPAKHPVRTACFGNVIRFLRRHQFAKFSVLLDRLGKRFREHQIRKAIKRGLELGVLGKSKFACTTTTS